MLRSRKLHSELVGLRRARGYFSRTERRRSFGRTPTRERTPVAPFCGPTTPRAGGWRHRTENTKMELMVAMGGRVTMPPANCGIQCRTLEEEQ